MLQHKAAAKQPKAKPAQQPKGDPKGPPTWDSSPKFKQSNGEREYSAKRDELAKAKKSASPSPRASARSDDNGAVAEDAPQVKTEPAADSSDCDVVESQRRVLMEAKPKAFAKAKQRPREAVEEATRPGPAALTLSSEQLMSVARTEEAARLGPAALTLSSEHQWNTIRMVIPQTTLYVVSAGLKNIDWRRGDRDPIPLREMSEVMERIGPWELPSGAWPQTCLPIDARDISGILQT